MISISFLIPSLFFNIRPILWNRECCTQKSRRGFETDETTEENIPLVHLPTDRNTDIRESDNYHSSANMATDDIYKLTLVDYTFEDAELFILLKRQCLHQAFREFKYLVDTRVKDKKEYIFKQRDENGCILLHYAAQGGSIVILEYIINKAPPDIIQYTCIRGQNALHFAMKDNKTDMFMHLINKYKNEFESIGAFAPVHWVAWQTKVWLLDVLEKDFDIFIKTRNGLNILDIACMTKISTESDKFCEDVLTKYNDPNKIDPMKTDLSGWNIAHYASMSGRLLLLKLIEKEQTLRSLITKETKWKSNRNGIKPVCTLLASMQTLAL